MAKAEFRDQQQYLWSLVRALEKLAGSWTALGEIAYGQK